MVHGLASSKECWKLMVPLLAPHARVICVDLPGHGESPCLPQSEVTPTDFAVVLETFMDSLSIHRAHLVGNSLGGWVVLNAAADGRADSVVALSPAGLWNPVARRGPIVSFNHTLAKYVRPAIPALLRIAPLRWGLVSSGVQRPMTLPYDIAVDAANAQANAIGFRAAFDGLIGSVFDRAHEIKHETPVAIAFGDHDRILNARQCQRRELAPTHATWQTLWSCGHAPMYDVPNVCSDIILNAARLVPA